MFKEKHVEQFRQELDSIQTWDELPDFVKNSRHNPAHNTQPAPKGIVALGVTSGLAFIGIMGWWIHNSKAPNDSVYGYNGVPVTTSTTSPANLPPLNPSPVTIQLPGQEAGK